MNIDIKDVHVGQAIDQRRNELGLSKSELGRRLGIPQQHINRLLERETMETKRLVKACKALDFNFFALFCPVNPQISAYLAAVRPALVALEVGDEITFHISRLKSVRTQASELGAIYNRQFKTRTDREKQTITVMRTL